MKKTFLLGLSTLWLFGAIHWQSDFQSAYQKSLQSGKPLFLFIERKSPPCRWCKRMKKTTLSDPAIASYIDTHFIPVKVAREEGDFPKELYPRYVPTIYVIQKQKVIKTIVGYWSPKDFQSDLKDIERSLE